MFALISSIPRESKNEAEIADFVFNLAKGRFEVNRDDKNNVIVYVPATPGFEDRPSVCLQGHLDMVCEKLKESTHNFTKDPIEFILKDVKLMANGTTLGADNGIGIAAMLAIIMDNNTIEHGPLELLFTTMEEVGFDGASALDTKIIKSRLIINLDSEEEGEIFVGCAGGGRVIGTFSITYVPSDSGMRKCRLTIKDLEGGHSGLEIHLGRANAIKILGRVL